MEFKLSSTIPSREVILDDLKKDIADEFFTNSLSLSQKQMRIGEVIEELTHPTLDTCKEPRLGACHFPTCWSLRLLSDDGHERWVKLEDGATEEVRETEQVQAVKSMVDLRHTPLLLSRTQ